MITLVVHALEKSTKIVIVTCKDEDGNLVVPNTMTWTLSDESGTIINSRENVVVSSLSSVTNIVLFGLDLAMQTGETDGVVSRIVTVKSTYNSSLGSNLTSNAEVRFYIDNLLNVT